MKKSISLLLLMSLALTTSSQDNDTLVWTIEKHMEFKRISNPDISKDGKYVAYEVREPVMAEDKSEYLSHIWVATSDGKMNVQYTRGDKSNTSPAFSPDGQWLAFLSERSDKTQLYLMRVLGGEAEQITDEIDGIGAFKWSPDSKSIAFLKKDEETEEEEQKKKEMRDVIEVDKNFKFNHLYALEIDGDRSVKRLTNGNFHISSFDWSPDGDKIVFAHKPDPKINTNRIESDISWVSSDSSAIHNLVNRPGPDYSPHFSPDGQKVAFQSVGGSPQPIGLSDVYVVDLENKEIEALVHTPDRSANIIGWSEDGSQIFISEAYYTSRVGLSIPSDPSAKKYSILTDLDGNSTSIDIAGNKMVYVYESTEQPPELHLQTLNNISKKRLTEINGDIDIPALGKTEVIKWKSKDGLEIEGLLTYPIGYKQGEKVPLVLQIHGGPAGVFTKTYTGRPSIYMTQYFAQEGVAVLRPNPRGSTGYGKDFRFANFKDWGFGDYEDVMSGVDKVIEMGVADPNKMTVMGWSYGGYLTSFLVTRTNRFKAASMGAGLPNLISMTTTTDIPDYLIGHMGAEVWDDYDTYEKHSAMYRIKNVKTPTQVIHGAKDLRVPFTQGQEFYVALQRRGIPTEMLVLPRTPHGPREPGLLMEVTPRIMNWFWKHLELKP